MKFSKVPCDMSVYSIGNDEGNLMKVKIVVMLRGREMQHNHLAYDLANRFLADLEGEKFTIERKPSMDGRNVITILAP